MRVSQFFASGLALLLGTLCAVSSGRTIMDTYEWYPTPCTPRDFPVYFSRGRLVLADGTRLYIPDERTLDNGWGALGGTHIVGQNKKPLPVQCELTWYSLLEDKSYQARFDLPIDRLSVLFGRGAASPDGPERWNFDTLHFGMAPGGDVSVWARARRSVVEVARYRAHPIDIPWTQVIGTADYPKEDYINDTLSAKLAPERLQAIRSAPLPLDRWGSAYAKRYSWSLAFAGFGKGNQVWLRGFNGEAEWVDLSGRKDVDPPPTDRGVPREVEVYWTAPSGASLNGVVTLNEEEALAAFGKLGNPALPSTMVLVVEPSDTGEVVDLRLERGRFVYRFEKSQAKIYRLSPKE
jgi:hypothetical protein